ncbi:hypothetical protein [Oryzomicrobium sp.]|uniref:hypothetical protein n=1 Tax=Oryzomicrobium sp. TaxID=1911578 RepID=UPI0025FF2474|nr:hypothetical protein [Oryzomicrobium sp.]MCE1241949.1 hypothetical protein [Oryzomicrobium sp.]
MIRQRYLEVVKKFEPYSVLLDAGATPAQVKEAIIALLSPYVADKELLRQLAVTVLANEAACIGQLSSRPDWKSLLDLAFSIRKGAIETNKSKSFETIAAFEVPIREAQRKYSLQIVFEQSKEGLGNDEYAFEVFRIIGALIESTIQPFVKELYCLFLIGKGLSVDSATVLHTDFGKIAGQFEKLLDDSSLLSPPPWNIRLNQWRNIAQHHSYIVSGKSIVAYYGKSNPSHHVELSREELFAVSKELIRRLGALKSSREITTLNHLDELRPLLPATDRDVYCIATELGAAFATQGFALLDLKENNGTLVAKFLDTSPNAGPSRHFHCSQFIVPIAQRFPDLGVQVHLQSSTTQDRWMFSAGATDLKDVLRGDNPLLKLSEVMKFQKNP